VVFKVVSDIRRALQDKTYIVNLNVVRNSMEMKCAAQSIYYEFRIIVSEYIQQLHICSPDQF